jgi:hypothetical protein
MKTKNTLFLTLIATMVSVSLYAQKTTDVENSKDYPLVSRFEGNKMGNLQTARKREGSD